jgi:hypothetical protein
MFAFRLKVDTRQYGEPTPLIATDTVLLSAPEWLPDFMQGVIAREAQIPERPVGHQCEFTSTAQTPPPSSNQSDQLTDV